MKRFIAVFVLSCCTVSGFVQQPLNIDSLKKLLCTENKEDTTRVHRLMHLANAYVYNKPDSGMYYANSGLQLSRKLGYTNGEAWAYRDLGGTYMVLGDYAQAMQNMLQALRLYRQMKSEGNMGYTENYIGDIYKEIGDYKQALHYYFGARKMIEIFMAPHGLMYSNACIGEAYLVGNRLDSALFFARRGFVEDRALRHDWAYPALVLGNVYLKRNQLDSALYCYQSTFKHSSQNDQVEINNGIATVYRQQNQPDSCRYYGKMAFDTAQAIRYQKGAMRASELLSWVYEKTAPAEAIGYYKIGTAIKDSLYDQEKIGRAGFLVFSDRLKEQELQATRAKYQSRLKVYGLLGVVGIFLIIAVFLWRNTRQRQKAYALLQKQKQETDHQKAKAESALEELQAAQSQLIQREKMASLGELTAGIAHEIQNPLNFVNNFSEVNRELVVELKQEARSGNTEEVLAIADNIEENEQKIAHHGKRADSIVKGMLQHSRSTTGHKEPTDINALADEYLRLSYHGMRAKDKDFNATLQTDFDESFGRINVVPQDIGRVFLNLFNNAFHAVNEKKKQVGDAYEPKVVVSTKKLKDRIEIVVKDNGLGIPQKVVDKVFQPFFTTKPTGQGTGLGLSLSYDIIKAHGGEIRVESKEGEGAEFILHLVIYS
jgi:signal transduction histidine kinase